MNTTKIGTEFEDKVYDYFKSLLNEDQLPFAPQKHSKIFKHKKYKCSSYSREIDFDITIETYNPQIQSNSWSSLVVIECKNLTRIVDISDFDEMRRKLTDISEYGVKGIMVTTNGFSRNGIEGAQKMHISLVVLSNNNSQWIVARNTNTKSEKIMPLLWFYVDLSG